MLAGCPQWLLFLLHSQVPCMVRPVSPVSRVPELSSSIPCSCLVWVWGVVGRRDERDFLCLGHNVLCGIGVIHAFDLEERGVGIRVALATLVGQVLALHIYCNGRRSCQFQVFLEDAVQAIVLDPGDTHICGCRRRPS